jgi:hypothetical protein
VKRIFFLLQLFLFIGFNFFLLTAVYQLAESSDSINLPDRDKDPLYGFRENFDPSLVRLNSLIKIAGYCDSLYAERSYNHTSKFEEVYPDIVSAVIRDRFYHGYSSYRFSNNFFGKLISKFGMNGLNAIVIPDDILKYPYAACSQQSIVFMEILKRKGFTTRKVGFNGKTTGHFCFEVYYEGGWHFYDPDMEPDNQLLTAYNHPSIALLVRHQDILLRAYNQYPKETVLDIFPTYFYGQVNSFEAPKAIIFQKVTKLLSYSIWTVFLLLFIMVRKKYKRLSSKLNVRTNRIRFPQLQPGTSPVYYPEYQA